MGGLVATISFDVANHGCPLDSSIREIALLSVIQAPQVVGIFLYPSQVHQPYVESACRAGVLLAVQTVTREQ
jgi:hypothetical protein